MPSIVPTVHNFASLQTKSIVLAANIVDGYPSEFEYTRDFLIDSKIRKLMTISHPLQSRSRNKTVIEMFEDGEFVSRRIISRPNVLPYSHVLDFMTGFIPWKTDMWIGFNPVMTAAGAMAPRSKLLVNWAIDFVPVRGEVGLAERAYRSIENFMMKRLDVQIENSEAAKLARTLSSGITPPHQIIAPIGVGKGSFSSPTLDRHTNRHVVYFGSVDLRNGAPFLLEIFQLLLKTDYFVKISIVGTGPDSRGFESLASAYPERVSNYGYVEDQAVIDQILRTATVALAPYNEAEGNFTEFADPQKLKYYAANGLPIILTDVSSPAQVMSKAGAAITLSSLKGVQSWIDSIIFLLDNKDDWYKTAKTAYEYSLAFDREQIYERTFTELISILNS